MLVMCLLFFSVLVFAFLAFLLTSSLLSLEHQRGVHSLSIIVSSLPGDQTLDSLKESPSGGVPRSESKHTSVQPAEQSTESFKGRIANRIRGKL